MTYVRTFKQCLILFEKEHGKQAITNDVILTLCNGNYFSIHSRAFITHVESIHCTLNKFSIKLNGKLVQSSMTLDKAL